jgi:hypothetical protein
MAMNKARRTANLNNILTYDTLGNSTLIANLTVEGLTGAGFVKADANGLLSVDTAAYTVVTGATNYLTKITAPNTLGQSLVYDNGTSVYVNSTTGVTGYNHSFTVVANSAGGMVVSTTNTASAIGIVNSASGNKTWDISPFNNTLVINESGVATSMVFHPGGNITIGDITTTGHKLEIVGSFRTTGNNTLSQLSGVGTRMVVVDTNGLLSTQAIASGSVTGTGVAGQMAYWTGTSAQSGSNNLFWDATNSRLGIGTNSPHNMGVITVAGNLILRPNGTAGIPVESSIRFYGASDAGTGAQITTVDQSGYALGLGFSTREGATVSEKLRIFRNGNVLLQNGGAFTDGGQRLQVQGDAFIKGSGNTIATSGLLVQNSSSNTCFQVYNDQNVAIASGAYFGASNIIRVGASSSAAANLRFTTSLNYLGFYGDQISTALFLVSPSAANNTTGTNLTLWGFTHTFNPTSGTASYVNVGIAPTINQTGGANGITRGLYVSPTLTAAADWRSIEWSNNSGWGLYGAGTANNYLAGTLGIGSTAVSATSLRIGRSISGATTSFGIWQDGTVQSTVTASVYGIINSARTQAASFVLSNYFHFYLDQYAFGAGSAVTNQYGYYADNLTGASFNYGFYGNIASGSNRWNLYMAGTAENYLGGLLRVNSQIVAGNAQATAGSVVLRSTYSSGNISTIGTNGSSGGVTIAYGAYPASTSTADAFLSGIGFASFPRSAYAVESDHRWLSAASALVAEGSAVTLTEKMRLYNSGNLVIQNGGTYADAGQRLQVYGDTLMRGSGNTTGSTALTVQNSDATNILRIRNDQSIFINATTNFGSVQFYPINNGGYTIASNATELRAETTFVNGTTVGDFGFSFGTYSAHNTSGANPVATSIMSSFSPTSGTKTFTILSVSSTINQVGATGITRGLYVVPTLTSATDWRSIEWSNNSGYGLYGAGTAQNLLNGKLRVEVTIPSGSHTNSANTIAVFGAQVLNIPAATIGTPGVVYAAGTSANYMRFNGNTTMNGDALFAGKAIINSLQFDTTGTITMNNGGAGGERALSGLQVQMQFAGATSGTVTKGASILIQGVYPNNTAGTVTFTDYYGLRINDLLEWDTGTGAGKIAMTNRWAISQAGANDRNYFNGFMLLGSTTSTGERLQVNGTMKVTGATSISGATTISSTLKLTALPTSNAGLTAGDIWNDAGTLKIA